MSEKAFLTPSFYPLLVERINFDNPVFLASAACSFTVGYTQYAYAIWLPTKGGKAAMPFWMHTFYLAHDSLFAYLLGSAALEYGGHWFLKYTSVALWLWSALEVWCIYRAVTKDRRAVFAELFGPNPGLEQVLKYVFATQCAWYAMIWVGIVLLGDGCFLQWTCLTNVGIAVGPLHEYIRRGSREGLSLTLGVVNIIGTIFTFSPLGMWVIILPEVFDRTEYYMAGAALVCYCTWCLTIVASYDSKPATLRQ